MVKSSVGDTTRSEDRASDLLSLRRRIEQRYPEFRSAREAREYFEAVQRDVMTALAAHRARAGLNQTEVALAMGTTQSSVSKIEAAGGDVGISTLLRYGSAIGLQPAELFAQIAAALRDRGQVAAAAASV